MVGRTRALSRRRHAATVTFQRRALDALFRADRVGKNGTDPNGNRLWQTIGENERLTMPRAGGQ